MRLFFICCTTSIISFTTLCCFLSWCLSAGRSSSESDAGLLGSGTAGRAVGMAGGGGSWRLGGGGIAGGKSTGDCGEGVTVIGWT